jgi:hypothetical protein
MPFACAAVHVQVHVKPSWASSSLLPHACRHESMAALYLTCRSLTLRRRRQVVSQTAATSPCGAFVVSTSTRPVLNSGGTGSGELGSEAYHATRGVPGIETGDGFFLVLFSVREKQRHPSLYTAQPRVISFE